MMEIDNKYCISESCWGNKVKEKCDAVEKIILFFYFVINMCYLKLWTEEIYALICSMLISCTKKVSLVGNDFAKLFFADVRFMYNK